VSPPNKRLHDSILGELWLEIDEAIAECGGATYGIVTKTIKENLKQFPWLTRDYLYNYRKRATKERKLPPQEISQPSSQSQTVSELSFVGTQQDTNGTQQALTDCKEELRLQAVGNFNNATKITAGVVFKGHGCILDQDVPKEYKTSTRRNKRRRKKE
jgi:hypothetical protein